MQPSTKLVEKNEDYEKLMKTGELRMGNYLISKEVNKGRDNFQIIYSDGEECEKTIYNLITGAKLNLLWEAICSYAGYNGEELSLNRIEFNKIKLRKIKLLDENKRPTNELLRIGNAVLPLKEKYGIRSQFNEPFHSIRDY